VRVANWFRWRRFANASPGSLTAIHGAAVSAKPQYCATPISELTTAAANQASANNGPSTRVNAATSNAPHNQDASRGTTAGEGPGANGSSHGSTSSGNAKQRDPPNSPIRRHNIIMEREQT
jgi:hypothetical protein